MISSGPARLDNIRVDCSLPNPILWQRLLWYSVHNSKRLLLYMYIRIHSPTPVSAHWPVLREDVLRSLLPSQPVLQLGPVLTLLAPSSMTSTGQKKTKSHHNTCVNMTHTVYNHVMNMLNEHNCTCTFCTSLSIFALSATVMAADSEELQVIEG